MPGSPPHAHAHPPPQAYGQAQPYGQAPSPPGRGVPDRAPTPAPHAKISAIQREAAAAGMHVGGVRTIAMGMAVTQDEAFAMRMKAFFLPYVSGTLRVDSVQAFLLRVGNAQFLLTIPWCGDLNLPHEFAAVVAGTLPRSLIYNHAAFNSGLFATVHGERDPLADEFDTFDALTDGIVWEQAIGRQTIEVAWGLQLLPLSDGRIVHVMKTAQHGLISKDFALPWYVARVTAFSKLLAARPASAVGPASFLAMPMSALFLDALGVAL